MLFVAFAVTFSCSQDQNENLTEVEDALLVQQNESNKGFLQKSVLIEWDDKTTEIRKEGVRRLYFNSNILVSFNICDDIKYETWVVNCGNGECNKDSDTPVDTDDDVHRIALNKTCEDL